ncbi:NAD(P)-binding domain-containing protein [Corynebacterium glutamicum]|uniref:NAD(P)-binding domain-containing protein n=1 Tax=Corynebacterium glutamicum TaxID=1718 RepID=UPI0009445695|nr:NAD(P)/FAD-dependent oxidoreductase [Corynebacterium glutamicum]OKX87514.1 FAD-dependent oxidoreductase [Corynebacterium glutamicum]QDX76698.1 FAD-dependent oxidoreductase [Corynebacterium glutamicum]QDX79475.1 FAD-dependent oxidoreductase [Corynebacterium glutamicum]TWS36267.1 FAD-dependent oxidoreductase [Corynebacterium glutamicum]TWS36629.1 FAD-dependent oxidoreductase [Corynebacterium glutamicum]
MPEQDLTTLANDWLQAFEKATASSSPDEAATAVVQLFEDEGYWRDLLAFTWNLTTAEGADEIAEMIRNTWPSSIFRNVELKGEPADEGDGVTRVHFSCESADFKCTGIVRLRNGKAWTLLTSARELLEHPEPKGRNREMGVVHGQNEDTRNWTDRKNDRQAALGVTEQPYTLIIGGGQGGIALGARLKRLGVPALIIDKASRPGDQWRSRYHSLCLHDPVWYDHLPYIPFPDHWPVFTPKDKMGDWLEHYVGIMDLDYWTNTECLRASYNEDTKQWDVTVNRDGAESTLHPTQLVMATGMSGSPNKPTLPGQDKFQGEIRHSSEHSGGDVDRDKNVVVLGANNSAHDICADLYSNGAKPVMIQRSSTHIVRSDSLMREVFGPLYSEDAVEAGIDTDTADLLFASWPYKVLPGVQKQAFDKIREDDKEFYDKLENAGFLLDFGDDDSGLFLKYLRRGSGYYIDVGASELVADGKIPVRSNVSIEDVKENSVVLTDGTELPADVIVLATGYGNMNNWVAQLVDQETADKVGPCWGLGSETTKDPGPWEGELRNMWKPTNVDSLWFHGGNLHQSRHYSRYLSMQLKARYEGMNTPVYSK